MLKRLKTESGSHSKSWTGHDFQSTETGGLIISISSWLLAFKSVKSDWLLTLGLPTSHFNPSEKTFHQFSWTKFVFQEFKKTLR